MNILDDIKQIQKLDPANMAGSIDLLSKQIQQAWQETQKIEIPAEYKQISKVVINGMGGSGLPAHIIQSLYFQKLRVPLGNIHSYNLPGIIDKNTLYILSSYSGDTEEPLMTYEMARQKGAKILAIASGGKLGKLIEQEKIPGYLFKPRYNVCNQPRMGIAYSAIGLLGLLKKCQLVKITDAEIELIINYLNQLKPQFSLHTSLVDNLAKQTAESVQGRIPIIVASGFLAGNAHVIANQINENAKNFSNYFIISELNHHLLEAFSFPKSNSKNLIFLFLESGLYHQRNQERFKITQDVLKKNKIDYLSYELQGQTDLEQIFETLFFGSYLSFYLAILNNVNPAEIPWVDYFKAQLK
jgi:glucose/mannose-6-phosphate isomerase